MTTLKLLNIVPLVFCLYQSDQIEIVKYCLFSGFVYIKVIVKYCQLSVLLFQSDQIEIVKYCHFSVLFTSK